VLDTSCEMVLFGTIKVLDRALVCAFEVVYLAAVERVLVRVIEVKDVAADGSPVLEVGLGGRVAVDSGRKVELTKVTSDLSFFEPKINKLKKMLNYYLIFIHFSNLEAASFPQPNSSHTWHSPQMQ